MTSPCDLEIRSRGVPGGSAGAGCCSDPGSSSPPCSHRCAAIIGRLEGQAVTSTSWVVACLKTLLLGATGLACLWAGKQRFTRVADRPDFVERLATVLKTPRVLAWMLGSIVAVITSLILMRPWIDSVSTVQLLRESSGIQDMNRIHDLHGSGVGDWGFVSGRARTHDDVAPFITHNHLLPPATGTPGGDCACSVSGKDTGRFIPTGTPAKAPAQRHLQDALQSSVHARSRVRTRLDRPTRSGLRGGLEAGRGVRGGAGRGGLSRERAAHRATRSRVGHRRVQALELGLAAEDLEVGVAARPDRDRDSPPSRP